MESKTYYMILGVSSTASPGGIKAAYRDLARRLHPDVAGEQATRAFQEISEAYAVLSDAQRRRDYNDKLKRASDGEIVAVRRVEAEPLVREPTTLLGNPERIRPSFEAMYERFLRNFTGIGVPKSEQPEALNFDVLLTPEEAARGCVVPVGVPVFTRCPQCAGSGQDWVFPCVCCRQQGMIENEKVVRIRVPPMVPSGSSYEIPLRGLGIHNFFLRIHVFVESQPGWGGKE
ncbi:MAG: DnaJ domain-containing protein [Polyangiaceae bacterium]|nr:DnaJ domain-containing protein [Polyangiaceae bacterium]